MCDDFENCHTILAVFRSLIRTFAPDMDGQLITLGMMQFTAVVVMTLLTQKLLRQRGKHRESRTATVARRLMTAATATLAVHFLLQLVFGLRLMGVTQSVMLNLTMLIPASYLFSRSVLLLQRRGQLSLADRWAGPAVWAVVMAMLAVAIVSDGQPLLSDTPERRLAEKMGAVLYMLMLGYYTWRHMHSLVAMRRTLHNYYDSDTDDMLRWMQTSIAGLMLLALMVPLAIFGTGGWLLIIAFAIYYFIFDLVDSFCYYLTSPAPAQLQAAEQNAAEVEEEKSKDLKIEELKDSGRDVELNEEAMQEVEHAVMAWMTRGGYRQSGLLQPLAAQAIGVTRYRLTCWLHQQDMKYTEWIAALRVEEAQRIIKTHPDWTNDAIAEHCGFTDRTILQRTFKKITGMTPAQYAERQGQIQ